MSRSRPPQAQAATPGPEPPFKVPRELLDQIVDNAPVLVYVRDVEGRFVMVNRLYEDLTGRKRGEILGRTLAEIFPDDTAALFRAHDGEVLQTKRPARFEETIRLPGGVRHWLALKTPLFDTHGRIMGIAGMSSDITDLRSAEDNLRQLNSSLEETNRDLRALQEQLIQAEKMESIGRLAAGVAHEVKNPLAMILMGIEYLSNLPSDTDPHLTEILGEMRKAVERADRIVRGLVDFSAYRTLEIHPAKINDAITETLPFLRHECARAGVQLQLDLAENLPLVDLDARKFEQVLLDLFFNALHALPERGGAITLWTSMASAAGRSGGEPAGGGRATPPPIRRRRRLVLAGISDNGCGIPESDIEKVFDPFFTTKPPGQGTGLGLSICRKIIELHGGQIQASRNPGGGTTFTITLKALSSATQNRGIFDHSAISRVTNP